MKKRFSTKLLSTVLSVAIAAMGTLVCPLSASAAEDDDQKIVAVYVDNQADEQMYGPLGNSRWGNGHWSIGYNIWGWQHNGDRAANSSEGNKPVEWRTSASDKVLWIEFNNSTYPNSTPTGDPLTVIGEAFRVYPEWQVKAHDISEYVATAMVSIKVRIDSPVFAENAYIVLGDSDTTGVPVGDQYTVGDAGTWKQINIPLSAFVNPDGDAIGNKFDPTTLKTAGLGFANAADLQAVGLTHACFDDFYICNVPKPRNLTIDSVEYTDVNLTWDAPLGVAR